MRPPRHISYPGTGPGNTTRRPGPRSSLTIVTVVARVGTSHVGYDQAAANLRREAAA